MGGMGGIATKVGMAETVLRGESYFLSRAGTLMLLNNLNFVYIIITFLQELGCAQVINAIMENVMKTKPVGFVFVIQDGREKIVIQVLILLLQIYTANRYLNLSIRILLK